jgi:hypothetical protein
MGKTAVRAEPKRQAVLLPRRNDASRLKTNVEQNGRFVEMGLQSLYLNFTEK